MTPVLADKIGIVFGVANKRSIAWAIAQAWHDAGVANGVGVASAKITFCAISEECLSRRCP